jgi:hypothetical protein
VRLKAAIELGTMAGIKTAGRYSLGMQLHLAFEDALEQYAAKPMKCGWTKSGFAGGEYKCFSGSLDAGIGFHHGDHAQSKTQSKIICR